MLICRRRRLEGVTRLGWRTVRVWVRVGISDDLARLVAEQDENATHKPLSPIEAAGLFREMRDLMREDATRLGAPAAEPARLGSGSGESPEPATRRASESRVQATRFVTQRDSHQQLEQTCAMERLAADRSEQLGSHDRDGDKSHDNQEGGRAAGDASSQTRATPAATRRADRTRFFDVVIPMVPFLSHHNARDLLNKELRRRRVPEGTVTRPGPIAGGPLHHRHAAAAQHFNDQLAGEAGSKLFQPPGGANAKVFRRLEATGKVKLPTKLRKQVEVVLPTG